MNLPPFKLERYFARHEFRVRHLMCASDCEAMTVGDLLAMEEGAARAFEACWLGYTEAAGAPALRREIARLYTTIDADQVLVHTGAEEAIFLFMQAVLSPADHVIVHWPAYQSLFDVARSLGCAVSFWKAREQNGWALDLDELRALRRPDTRAVVVNMPHNPTGHLMTAAHQAALVEIVRGAGLILFSDEVYRESEYDPARRLPAACDLDEKAVSLGVLSKTYGLPGLRIGWIATRNPEIHRRMAALKDYTTICNSAPSEFLAALALRRREALAARSLAVIRRNLGLLEAFFARHGDRFAWVPPQAGPIAFPRLKGGDAAAFCRRLLEDAGVLLLPGAVYDFPGPHFRVGFGRHSFPQALEALEAFIGGERRSPVTGLSKA